MNKSKNKKSYFNNLCLMGLAQAGLVSVPMVSQAEAPFMLEEVVVTATRAGNTMAQDTPISMSVLSWDKLSDSGVTNVKDLAQLVPNLNISAITVAPLIYIRGIGSNNVNNGSDPDVTVQVDGVYIARPFGQLSDFLDVERIEVLRGPQGTLYGRNAVGGVINVVSRKPSEELAAEVRLTVGTYGLRQFQGYMTGALSETVQASLTINDTKRSGYVENIVSSRDKLNDADRSSAKLQVRYAPTDRWEAITRADWTTADEHFDNYTHLLTDAPYAPLATMLQGRYDKVALDTNNENATRIWGISEEINYIIDEHYTVKSLTAFRQSKFTSVFDTDGTEAHVSVGVQADNAKQFSQELNLTAKFPKFKGVVGLFFFNEKQKSVVEAILPPSVARPAFASAHASAFPIAKTNSIAAFAQGTYQLTDALGLTVGLRYTRDEKSLVTEVRRISLNPATPGAFLPGSPFTANTHEVFDEFTPKFGLEWQVTEDALFYASATRGFKSGGTNYGATNVNYLSYEPETIWAYESGLKSDWFDSRLRANASIFYYDYQDLQVLQPLAPGVIAINNAASAKIKGAELEVSAMPTENFLVTASATYLDAKFDDFAASGVARGLLPYVATDPNYSAATRTYNASGNRMNSAPRATFSASAQYNFDLFTGGMYVRGEYYWQDKVSYDPSNVEIMFEPSYDLVNVILGYKSSDKRWGVLLQARNIFDTQHLVGRSGAGGFAAGLAGPPRTFALQISRNW
ncbi:MAG: TonB-dependent receptor [Emcibacter sp.]|nr:TonB-dependent receptor [Emcibacter sp.]